MVSWTWKVGLAALAFVCGRKSGKACRPLKMNLPEVSFVRIVKCCAHRHVFLTVDMYFGTWQPRVEMKMQTARVGKNNRAQVVTSLRVPAFSIQ